MMPHHPGMVRSQCRIVESFGGGVATSLATIRLSPQAGREAGFQTQLAEALCGLAQNAGLTGAHLLLTDTPRASSPTTEQQIRDKDGAADWIVLLSGYDPDAVWRAVAEQLSPSALHAAGASDNPATGRYRLSFTMTPLDITAR